MKYTILAYTDIQKTKLEYSITFDAVLSASESYSNTVTAHTVEDGGVINDHVIKSKDKITIEGVVTDLSFNQGDLGIVMFSATGELGMTITEAWSRKTKKALLDINEKSMPCSLKVSEYINGQEVIESETFPCLVENLNLDKSGGQYGFIQPKITLVPVRIATIEFQKLTAEQQAIPALKNDNASSTTAKTKTGGKDGKDAASADGKEVPLGLIKDKEIEEASGGVLSKIGKKVEETNGDLRNQASAMHQRNAGLSIELENLKNGR